jgi:hypothetical protein
MLLDVATELYVLKNGQHLRFSIVSFLFNILSTVEGAFIRQYISISKIKMSNNF